MNACRVMIPRKTRVAEPTWRHPELTQSLLQNACHKTDKSGYTGDSLCTIGWSGQAIQVIEQNSVKRIRVLNHGSVPAVRNKMKLGTWNPFLKLSRDVRRRYDVFRTPDE